MFFLFYFSDDMLNYLFLLHLYEYFFYWRGKMGWLQEELAACRESVTSCPYCRTTAVNVLLYGGNATIMQQLKQCKG